MCSPKSVHGGGVIVCLLGQLNLYLNDIRFGPCEVFGVSSLLEVAPFRLLLAKQVYPPATSTLKFYSTFPPYSLPVTVIPWNLENRIYAK